MKLIKTDAEIVGEKRQHFPYLIEAICSSCGESIKVDFKYDYLAEPKFGKRVEVPVSCIECGHIGEVWVIPRISLEIVK